MNPFRLLDNLLGPLDVISTGIGTAKMLAKGQISTDCIAIRRPNQRRGVAVLRAAGYEPFSDTYSGDWIRYRVAAGQGQRAVQLLGSHGIDAVMASQIGDRR